MLKCHVFSNIEFNRIMKTNGWNDYNLPDNVACISICDPDYEDSEFGCHWFSNNTDRVLNLDFYDILEYKLKDRTEIYGLTDEQAHILYEFIKKNVGKDFYIHCAAGVSRSQGVARYIVDTYPEYYSNESLRKENPCEFPNIHVVSLLKHLYYDENFNNS